MSSGIVQLVAIGAQDEHITGKPEISFFNSSFKRHSNFSQSVEKQVIQGTVNPNSISTVRFERSGDLLGYTYICFGDGTQSYDTSDWMNIIDSIELLIGGQVIDTQDSIFSEKIAIDTFAQNGTKSAAGPHGGGVMSSYFYPLRFFFCENPQSAIPLVAMQYHNVEIRIRWGARVPTDKTWEVFSNYYYLDNEERMNMSLKNHSMLIYQVQKNIPSCENIHELTFNHPIKFIACSNTSYVSSLTSQNNKIKVSINGVDICGYKWARPHFIDCSFYYHTNFASSPDVFMLPFCITTSLLQPTGSLNFSRIDSAKIHSETMPITDPIYAVNYNILRVENGMAGLVYAN